MRHRLRERQGKTEGERGKAGRERGKVEGGKRKGTREDLSAYLQSCDDNAEGLGLVEEECSPAQP